MAATDSTAGTPAQQMGQQLRQAREAAGLEVDAAAARLRMQKGLIRALEAGDWSRLGAPVFVRGHLRSYARLLGIELDGLDEVGTAPSTPVIPLVRARRGQQWFGRLGTRLVYVLITALVGVPVWMAAQRHLSAPDAARAVALDIPEVRPVASSARGAGEDAPAAVNPAAEASAPPAAGASARPFTAVASLIPSPAADAAPAEIILHFSQDSWVELYAPGGRSLEQNLLKAGEVRRFARGQLGRVVIGNADGVTLRIGGEVRDLSGVRRANVARFAVSSDGSIGPVAD